MQYRKFPIKENILKISAIRVFWIEFQMKHCDDFLIDYLATKKIQSISCHQ